MFDADTPTDASGARGPMDDTVLTSTQDDVLLVSVTHTDDMAEIEALWTEISSAMASGRLPLTGYVSFVQAPASDDLRDKFASEPAMPTVVRRRKDGGVVSSPL